MSKYKYKKSAHKTKRDNEFNASFYLLLPLFLIAVVLPLIVKYHPYQPKLMSYSWFPNIESASDLFLYHKQWFFVIVCSVMMVIILLRALINHWKLNYSKIFIPLIIYMILAILSTVFSDYRYFGVHGIFEQFESVFCLLGYPIVAYYAYLTIQGDKELDLMIKALSIGALILGIIGSLQAFGITYFSSSFINTFIFPAGISTNDLEFSSIENQVYSTLFNPNYVGVYTAFIIPFFTILLILSKKLSERILYTCIILTSVLSLFGSQSKTALISIAVSALVAIILLRKVLVKIWIVILPLLLVTVITFVLIDNRNGNVYTNAIKKAFTISKMETPLLSAINTSDQGVQIVYNQNSLFISVTDQHDLVLTDESGNTVPYSIYQQLDDSSYIIQAQDIRFNAIPIANYLNNETIDFTVFDEEIMYSFSKQVIPGTYSYLNRYNKFSPLITTKASILQGYEHLATHRGYIWSRSIPLIKDNIIIGSGAESFMFEFPQYDYLTVEHNGFYNGIITKPHNYYLQVAIQTGLISLLCILSFYIIYLRQSFKLLFKNTFESKSSKISLAALVAIISYLISGISNDSNITITPVIWVIIGIGLAANKIAIQNNTGNK